MHRANLRYRTCLLITHSRAWDFTDVLTEMQKTVHMPGGKSRRALQWFDVNGKPTFTHPYVSKAVQRQLNRADREASSIQSSIVTPMTLYDDPIVQKTVSRSDFVIRDLVYGEVPMSLYFKSRSRTASGYGRLSG